MIFPSLLLHGVRLSLASPRYVCQFPPTDAPAAWAARQRAPGAGAPPDVRDVGSGSRGGAAARILWVLASARSRALATLGRTDGRTYLGRSVGRSDPRLVGSRPGRRGSAHRVPGLRPLYGCSLARSRSLGCNSVGTLPPAATRRLDRLAARPGTQLPAP